MRQKGRLRHRITLQQKSTTFDQLGRQNREASGWVEHSRPFAEIRELSGSELERARQIVADCNVLITLHWRGGVTSQLRAVWGERIFEIKAAIDPDSMQQSLLLFCTETQR
jgi:SPP1 family predicted phage head-tail adaptor